MAALGLSQFCLPFNSSSPRCCAHSYSIHTLRQRRCTDSNDCVRTGSKNEGTSTTRLLASYDQGSQAEQGFPLLDLPWDSFTSPPPDIPESEELSVDTTFLAPPYCPLPTSSLFDLVLHLSEDESMSVREGSVCQLWAHSLGGAERAAEVASVPNSLPLLASLLRSGSPPSAQAAAAILGGMKGEEVRLVECGAGEAAAMVVEDKGPPIELVHAAAALLALLSSHPHGLTPLTRPRVLPALLPLLASSSPSAHHSAALCLHHLAQVEDMRERVVAAGAVPLLAEVVLAEGSYSNSVRAHARSALTSLSSNEATRRVMQGHGVVVVPLIGPEAYASMAPMLTAPPPAVEGGCDDLPSSTFGAGEVLAGLRYSPQSAPVVDEDKAAAMEGAIRARFLARIGVLEKKEAAGAQVAGEHVTVMPHWDAIPRLVLILGLEDAEVGARAAEAIVSLGTEEDYAVALRSGGAVGHLVRLLGSGSERATLAAATALTNLSHSPEVARAIAAHSAVSALLPLLAAQDAPEAVEEKVVAALRQLAVNGGCAEEVVEMGGIPLLVEVLRKGSVEGRVQATELCGELAGNRGSAERLMELGVPALLDSILSIEDGSPDVRRLQQAARQCASKLGG